MNTPLVSVRLAGQRAGGRCREADRGAPRPGADGPYGRWLGRGARRRLPRLGRGEVHHRDRAGRRRRACRRPAWRPVTSTIMCRATSDRHGTLFRRVQRRRSLRDAWPHDRRGRHHRLRRADRRLEPGACRRDGGGAAAWRADRPRHADAGPRLGDAAQPRPDRGHGGRAEIADMGVSGAGQDRRHAARHGRGRRAARRIRRRRAAA